MHGVNSVDGGNAIDWGKTSTDYAAYRSGPPASFFRRLAALDVGLSGQRVLDLGTGTGVIARQLARQGASVVGIDVAGEQVGAAARLAREEGLDARFVCGPAEAAPFRAGSFDVVTANQCWLYFDEARMIPEVARVLGPGGVLVTSHNCWLPRQDPIAAATEALVLSFNPQWAGADWAGVIPACPGWAQEAFDQRAMFYYDEPVRFTREQWRGRVRACRGVGATMAAADVARFDAELSQLLERIAHESFEVIHRIDAHVLAPRRSS